jgi:hypothetical protein
MDGVELMSESKRKQHEKRYDSWTTLESKGRLYRKEIIARNGSGWKAVYLQEVDEKESVVRFWQEIYNEKNELVEIHEKYPEDKGHVIIQKEL